MPLATKNNALIVKDGKVAENCGCCVPVCSLPPLPDSIVIELTSSGTTGYGFAKFRHFQYNNPSVFSDFTTAFACVAPRSGMYVLTGSGSTYSYDAPGIQIQALYRTITLNWLQWEINIIAQPFRISQNLGDSPLSKSALESDSWFSTSCAAQTFTTTTGQTLSTCWRLGGNFSTAGVFTVVMQNICQFNTLSRRKGAQGSPVSSPPLTVSSGCVPPYGVSGTISGLGIIPRNGLLTQFRVTEDETAAYAPPVATFYLKEKTNATLTGSSLFTNACEFSLSVQSCVAVYGADQVPFFDPRYVVSC